MILRSSLFHMITLNLNSHCLMVYANAKLIPVIQPVHPFIDFYFMMPSQRMEFGNICKLTRSAVWL